MPTPSDNAGARELSRMVARYVDTHPSAYALVGVTEIRALSYYMGKSTMTLPVIVALARVLGMTPGDLLKKAEARYAG